MKFLEILKERNQKGETDLYDVYNKMHETSMSTWIPAASSDNSIPHIRSVEVNVDKLMPAELKENINSAEIFILLSSILLHDLGKIDESKNCHGSLSSQIIQEHWSHLLIPNIDYSRWIAAVCCAHCWDEPNAKDHNCDDDIKDHCKLKCQKRDDNICELDLIYESEYGPIRLYWIAALLRVADELDHSMERSIPNWLKGNMSVRGEKYWRQLVQSVHFDAVGQCIKLNSHNNINWGKKHKNRTHIEWCLKAIKNANKVLENWAEPLRSIGIKYSHLVVEICNPLPELYTYHPSHKKTSIISWGDCKRFIETPIEVGHFETVAQAVLRLVNGIIDREIFTWEELAAESGIHEVSLVQLITSRLKAICKNSEGNLEHYEKLHELDVKLPFEEINNCNIIIRDLSWQVLISKVSAQK